MEDLTAHEILQGLHSGTFTSAELVQRYLSRIDATNDTLKAVLQLSRMALQDAQDRDRERRDANGRELGALHGLPILLKASFATEARFGMDTTSGNFALVGSRPKSNAGAVQKLLDAGAVIVGKTTMSELAFWKITQIPAGWSPVGGQGQNPYVKGGRRADDPVFSINGPGGSSSGASIGVAAGYAPIAIGEETSGSLVFPAERATLYTIKPTVGTVDQSGMVPVSHRFDVAGPLAKSSRDVALLLNVLIDRTDKSTPQKDYTASARGVSGWKELRVGVLDIEPWLYSDASTGLDTESKQQIIREVTAAYQLIGTNVKTLKSVAFEGFSSADEFDATVSPLMWKICEYDYQKDFELYLSTIDNSKISSLRDLLTSDDEYGAFRTPTGEHGYEDLKRALDSPISEAEAEAAERELRAASREGGIDGILNDAKVDVILGPGAGSLYSVAAAAGYPIATLPLSYLKVNNCPFGLVALASAHQEEVLVALQSAWEETFPKRKAPAIQP